MSTTPNLAYPYEYLDGVLLENLSTSLPGLPAHITIGGTVYSLRSHLHCTIVSIKDIVPRLARERQLRLEPAETMVREEVVAALAVSGPRLAHYLPELRVAHDTARERQTIIMRVETRHSETLFAQLEQDLQLTLPRQPSHVTLYAVNDLPIGLPSQARMDEISRPLTPPELQDWGKAVDTQAIFGVTL